jgi:hypothetical protein
MFEFLRQVPDDEAISAVYYAIRLITHRRDLVDVKIGLKVEGLKSEPSEEDDARALLIVEEIEQAEDLDIRHLEDTSAEPYIAELVTTARQRAVTKFGCDWQKGLELLAQFQPAISQEVGQAGA